jgi:hypothetical protein
MAEIDALKIVPGQEITVDLLRPEDAPGVAALFHVVYGEEYPVKTYYQPSELIEANRKGDVISCVVRTSGGDIVGHNAMYRIAPCPKVYEGGASLVLPAYRNTAKLFERMVVLGIKAVPRFGGEGVYGEHVCNHLFTQKAAVSLGNVTMGLEVGLMPAAAYDKEKSAQGRVSSFHGFQTLKPHPHAVHLPQVYDDSLRFIYEGLVDERSLDISTQSPPTGSRSRLTAEIYDYAQVMRITAWELGEDLAEALARPEAEAVARGVEVYQVWLPLAAPWVGWAVDELRGWGWFLGGVLPRWFDEDGLLMQRLAHTPDWDGMQILTERSQEIVRLVRRDWEAVGGSR